MFGEPPGRDEQASHFTRARPSYPAGPFPAKVQRVADEREAVPGFLRRALGTKNKFGNSQNLKFILKQASMTDVLLPTLSKSKHSYRISTERIRKCSD